MTTTRKKTQQETKDRLLDAAIKLAARDGLAAMSTRAICEQAGFTIFSWP